MPSNLKIGLQETLITALIVSVAIGPNAVASVLALAVLVSSELCKNWLEVKNPDQFQTALHNDLVKLRSDFAKVKAKQDQGDLKAAFGGSKVV